MKDFFQMKIVRRFFISDCFFEKVIIFQKVLFSAVVFIAVFYFHLWPERYNNVSLFHEGSLAGAVSEASSAQKKEAIQSTLNLNTASLKELTMLPGIGPKLADDIIKDREQNGPFLQLKDFLRVRGIGPKKLEKIAPFLHFDTPPK